MSGYTCIQRKALLATEAVAGRPQSMEKNVKVIVGNVQFRQPQEYVCMSDGNRL
jgi:hypothetical protein